MSADPDPAADDADHRRQRALSALRDELARATADALARGVSAEAVAEFLDARTARLGSRLSASEDVPDDSDDAVQLGPVGE